MFAKSGWPYPYPMVRYSSLLDWCNAPNKCEKVWGQTRTLNHQISNVN